MRSIIQIDDELLMTLKEQAHRQNSSLTHLVDQTLRAGLQAAKAPSANKPPFREQPLAAPLDGRSQALHGQGARARRRA